MDHRRAEIVARNRAAKANRIITYLDRHLGQRATAADVEHWKVTQWQRAITRAGETFNSDDPMATPNAVIARLQLRDRVNGEKRRSRVRHLVAV